MQETSFLSYLSSLVGLRVLNSPSVQSFLIVLGLMMVLITFKAMPLYLPTPSPHPAINEKIVLPAEEFIHVEEQPTPSLTISPDSKEQKATLQKEAHPWLEYKIRKRDTFEKILKEIHADDEMRQFLLTQKFKTYRRLRVKDTVYFKLNEKGHLSSLLYKATPEYYFMVGYDEQGKPWAKEEPPLLQKKKYSIGGRIDSSLFLAADQAGMSDGAISGLIGILESRLNFYRDVRKGDTFRAVYDELVDESGDYVKLGQVYAFEYNNSGHSRPRLIQGVWWDEADNYYTPEGESFKGAFLPAPLKYTRISSKFTLRRFHPVLKRWRAHRGVDYAARTGTPVLATADGTVTKVSKERGYGNVIFIKHFDIYTTVYGHLNRFAKKMKKGKRVKQGEVIGYVGQTGLATGPHLHYEFRIRNVHKDPLSVDIPKQLPPLKADKLSQFLAATGPFMSELKAVIL